MPSPCCMHPALALLAAALLAGAAGRVAARPAGTRPPQPNPDFFAMHPLASESRVGVRVDQANMCEQGYTVAGIAFSKFQADWETSVSCGAGKCFCDLGWVVTPGHLRMRVYFTKRDGTGEPVFVDMFGPPDQQILERHHWVAFNPGEQVKRITLTSNGFNPGNMPEWERVGAVSIETSAQKYTISSIVPDKDTAGCQKRKNSPWPSAYQRTVIGTGLTETPQFLGSGVLCGFRATASADGTWPGSLVELAPIFFHPITKAEVTNVKYPSGWQAQQGPLQPQVSASVRVDNRGSSFAGSVVFGITTTNEQSTTVEISEGSSVARTAEAKISLEVPVAMFDGSSLSLSSSAKWETSQARSQGTSTATNDPQSVEATVNVLPGKMSQISLVHYQSTYDVPYTATMALSLRPKVAEPPKRLAFATSGRVAGVTTTQTKYITCALGANGELCPQLQPAAPPAPTPDPPQPPMDVPTLIAKYLRRTKVMGQKGDIAVPYGVTQCLTGGKYLARIEHYAQEASHSRLWASAGFKVYYTSGLQGEAPEVITIGKPETGARTGVCELGPADTVAWGANYDNNRCNPSGNQCRWGKLVLKIRGADGRLRDCTLQVRGHIDGKIDSIGPAQFGNIGSGRLCGVTVATGLDVDGLGLLFMRPVRDALTRVKQTAMDSLRPPAAQDARSVIMDARGETPGGAPVIIQGEPFNTEVVQSQAWSSTNTVTSSTSIGAEINAELFGIVSTSAGFGREWSTTTETRTSGTASKTTSMRLLYKFAVPPGQCVNAEATRFAGAGTVEWSGTTRATFDNGQVLTMPVRGGSTVKSDNIYTIKVSKCGVTGRTAAPGQQ